MRVSGDWLTNPASQSVCAMLTDAGHQVYFVGGCVRNALLGAPVGDIDLTTDAHPDKVTDLGKKAGFNVVATGIEHGTVTVVANKIPHEITTFRKDVETDGRRAVVSFSDTYQEDAHRRDFTMNALYADPNGAVFDPVGGLADIDQRLVRFIDDAKDRIREDYLRTLRFFRFNAWYGDEKTGYDPEALAAIAGNLDGLSTLSRERVGAELLKLLSAPNPVSAIAVMRQTGVLTKILPGSDDTLLGPLVFIASSADVPIDPLARLAALGGENLSDRLRLSRAQAKTLTLLRDEMGAVTSPEELGYRHGANLAAQVLVLRAALFQQPLDPKVIEASERATTEIFPVQAKDLMPDVTGPALGARLRELETRWIDSQFKLSREELLLGD